MYEEFSTEEYIATKFRQTSESAFKKRVEKQEKQTLYQIRGEFQKGLAKLNDEHTKALGFREVQNIILEHRSRKWLRLYLSLLCDKIMKTNRTEVILLFGFLAQIYQNNLIDPLEQPPSLIKTVIKIWEEIYSYLKKNVNLVEEACSKSLIEIFKHCILEKDDKQLITAIFYKPLAGFIASGGDRIAQAKASYILNKFMSYLIEEDYFDLANFLAPKIIALYIKSSCQDYELTEWITLIVKNLGVKYFISVLTDLRENIVDELGTSDFWPQIIAKQIGKRV